MTSHQPTSQPVSASGKGEQAAELIGDSFWLLDEESHGYPNHLETLTATDRPVGLPKKFLDTGLMSLMAKRRILDSRGPNRYNYIRTQFNQAITTAKTDFPAIKNEYVALSAEEKITRKEEFQRRWGAIVRKLRDFQNDEANKWMFLNDPYKILTSPDLTNECTVDMTAIRVMRAGFQITTLLVEGLERKLSDEAYLKNKDGFFDFAEYVESASASSEKDGGREFISRKMPEFRVEVIEEASGTGKD